MKWYGKELVLDYSKPIMCGVYLLVPQLEKNNMYNIIGYNWFNLTTGSYNSCSFYRTPQEAVDSYGIANCKNVNITTEEL